MLLRASRTHAPLAVASPSPARTSEKYGASAWMSVDAANCGLSERHAPHPIECAIARIGLSPAFASLRLVHS